MNSCLKKDKSPELRWPKATSARLSIQCLSSVIDLQITTKTCPHANAAHHSHQAWVISAASTTSPTTSKGGSFTHVTKTIVDQFWHKMSKTAWSIASRLSPCRSSQMSNSPRNASMPTAKNLATPRRYSIIPTVISKMYLLVYFMLTSQISFLRHYTRVLSIWIMLTKRLKSSRTTKKNSQMLSTTWNNVIPKRKQPRYEIIMNIFIVRWLGRRKSCPCIKFKDKCNWRQVKEQMEKRRRCSRCTPRQNRRWAREKENSLVAHPIEANWQIKGF